MKVRYVGNDLVALRTGKIYYVLGEKHGTYDGCGDKYIFSDGKRENMLEADNTWYYEEHREKGSEDTRIVINVIQNIRDILCDAGIERDALVL